MTMIRHLNCGILHKPPGPVASCHCLLLDDPSGALALIDSGIGMKDVSDPVGRLGHSLIDQAGFRFHSQLTAVEQIRGLGLRPEDVRHVVLTHGDPDHAGGLSDFPRAQVHVASEELASIRSGHIRYVAKQFEDLIDWQTYDIDDTNWFGLPARKIELGFTADVLLVPLFGHTKGHCGVAVSQGSEWFLHAGDAYYLRVELSRDDHPVSQLAELRADDDVARRESLDRIRKIARNYGDQVTICGYHDIDELPAALRNEPDR